MPLSTKKIRIFSFSWRDLAIFCALFGSAVLLCILLHMANSSEGFAYSIFVLTVLLISRFTTGYLFGTLAAVLSVVGTNYIFTYPYWAVNFTLSGYPLTFLTMLVVSLVTCTMTTKIKRQEDLRIEAAREKMRANLLRSVSHDIRTPLTSINLLVERLSASGLTDECRHQLTNELYELLGRIDWLITTLLKISRLDAGTVQFKQEQVSLEELLKKSCVTLLIPMELRGQALLIHADGAFRGDLSWTSEAIGNIVKNCMEHTPEGGRIEIDAAENALYSEIIIKDNGTGISPEDLPHIFERFYKGKDSDGKSFGIGLALSRMIITGQGGTVKAENRKPAGAMFTIRFYKGTV